MSCICLLIYASFLINYMPPDAQTAGVYGADTAVAMILNASEDKLSGIFRGHDDGSNGFRRLSDFRASEYDTPEGRRTKRTMKRILATYDHPMLMDRIAGKNLLSLLGYEKGPAHIRSATHALSDPKYLITESGIIVLGKRRLIAPWNDIITFWYTIDCYFVGFDGQVALIRSADINTSRKPSMAGIIEVPLESLHYEYPGSDNAEREDDGFRPPEFIDGEQALKRFLEGNIIYREYALELGIAGNAKAAFTVDANGNLGDIRIIKSVDTILDKEIIVALQKTAAMWKAGNIDGVGIPVSVTLMVKFRIR